MRTPTLGSGLLVLVLTAAISAPGADADPADPDKPSVSDVRAATDRASAAKTDVDRLQEKLDNATAELEAASIKAARAAEAWNGARWEAKQARTAKKLAVAASAAADRTKRVQKADYRDSVISAEAMGYQLSAIGALVAADGMESLVERSAAFDHVQAMFDQQRDEFIVAADEADDAEAAATKASDRAERAEVDARVAKDEAAAASASASATAGRIERRKARLLRSLARLEGISVTLAQRRQDAIEEERRAARAAATPTPAASPAPAPQPNEPNEPNEPAPETPAAPAPNPGNGAKAAIAFARAQIGEPYRWGAAGPNSWDCSGLTAEAWAAGGKSLPHYSVAQYDVSTPISAGQLRPGDLVFWGEGNDPGSIYHVALYAGNGQIIHAPRTGRPVTEESIHYWRAPDFYARP